MWAKQSTAKTISVGPCLDSTGAEYTSLVIGDLTLCKNGTSAAMASAATLTHVSNGHYDLVMTTGNTDTLGVAQIRCNKSGYQIPSVEMMVIPSTVYDALVTNAAGGANGLLLSLASNRVNVGQWLDTTVATPNTAGVPIVEEDLGRQFTAAGGGSASVTLDASASSTINYYNGWALYPISGTGARQCPMVITAYNGSTKVATIARAWATTTDSTTVFRMWPTAVSVEAWKLGVVPTPGFTGVPSVDVLRWNGTAVSTPSTAGIPEVNVKNVNNVATSSVTTVGSHLGTSGANTPQTGDAYARLGAPAGASVSADIATKSTQTSVDDIPTNAELATALGTADDAVLAAIAALNNLSSSDAFTAVLTTQLTESYAADGTAPTLAQAIFLIQQSLHEFAISGTTRTVKKLDGSTTAATFTLDSSTAPTSTTRAS